MTKKECAEEALVQLQAGSETTSVAIRTTLMYIMSTPRVYIRMKEMIKQCVDSNEVSSPITFEEAQRFPYLKASTWISVLYMPLGAFKINDLIGGHL